MKLSRLFTQAQGRAYAGIDFERRSSRITNTDGTTVFEAADIEVPQGWSQVAVDIMAQKYFRKAGVPARLRRVPVRQRFHRRPPRPPVPARAARR